MLIEKPTQAGKILLVLQKANGEYVNGQYFLREMYISQYHARLFSLIHDKEKYNYDGVIEASPHTDEYGFKSYRLIQPDPQIAMNI